MADISLLPSFLRTVGGRDSAPQELLLDFVAAEGDSEGAQYRALISSSSGARKDTDSSKPPHASAALKIFVQASVWRLGRRLA